jgi:hypothetical protein
MYISFKNNVFIQIPKSHYQQYILRNHLNIATLSLHQYGLKRSAQRSRVKIAFSYLHSTEYLKLLSIEVLIY